MTCSCLLCHRVELPPWGRFTQLWTSSLVDLHNYLYKPAYSLVDLCNQSPLATNIKLIMHDHCLLSSSATRVTTECLKQPICYLTGYYWHSVYANYEAVFWSLHSSPSLSKLKHHYASQSQDAVARFSYGTTGDVYLLLNAHSQLDNLLATDRKVSICISQCIPCTLNLARKNDIQLSLDQTGSCMYFITAPVQ